MKNKKYLLLSTATVFAAVSPLGVLAETEVNNFHSLTTESLGEVISEGATPEPTQPEPTQPEPTLTEIPTTEEVPNTNLGQGSSNSGLTSLPPKGSEFTVGGFKMVEVDGGLKVIDYTGSEIGLAIPPIIEGLNIIEIAKDAFKAKGLINISIPSTIRVIGEGAFEGNAIRTVAIPNSLDFIGSRAFANNMLESVTLPSSNASLGDSVFENNKIMIVQIPEQWTVIPKNAFKNNLISTLTINSALVKIEDEAFSGNNLSVLKLPKGLTSIGYRAFRGNQLQSVYIPQSVTTLGDYAYSDNPIKSLTAPKRLTSQISKFVNSSELDHINLYEDGADPQKDIKNETTLTEGDYLLNLGISSGLLSLKKPTLLNTNLGNQSLASGVNTINLSFSDSLEILDTRGTGEGWHLTIQATPFTQVAKVGGKIPEGGWHKLPKGTVSFSGFSNVSTKQSDGTKKANPSGVTVSRSSTVIDDGAVTVASATKNSGYGVNVLDFNANALSITIDPNTVKVDNENYKGQATPYSSTVTWTLVSGPGSDIK